MKVGSDTIPDKVRLLQGKQLVSFNIESYLEDDNEGVERTKYTYEILKLSLEHTSKDITRAVNLEKKAVVDAKIKELTQEYCEGEVGSFWKQEAEARAYIADDTASTPFLTPLAISRGIPIAELVDKIIANADNLTIATATLLGKYQASLSEEFTSPQG